MAPALPFVVAAATLASAGASIYSATRSRGGRGPAAPPSVGVGERVRQAAPGVRANIQARGITASPYFESQELGRQAFEQFGYGGESLDDYMREAEGYLGIASAPSPTGAPSTTDRMSTLRNIPNMRSLLGMMGIQRAERMGARGASIYPYDMISDAGAGMEGAGMGGIGVGDEGMGDEGMGWA